MCGLAEPIHADRLLSMLERSAVITLNQRQLGDVQPRIKNPRLVGAAELRRPPPIWLVIEHLTAHKRERVLKTTPNDARWLSHRTPQQCVEPVEIESEQMGVETVRPGVGDDGRACPLPLGGQMTTEDGNERLERAGSVHGRLVPPEQVSEAICRYEVPSGG